MCNNNKFYHFYKILLKQINLTIKYEFKIRKETKTGNISKQWKSNFERETYTIAIIIIIVEMKSPSENHSPIKC